MSTQLLALLEQMPDEELLARARACVGREADATARLVAHLAALDARRLYLAEGHSSLYVYCVQVLHLSEHASYGRIAAARCARRFPVVLDYLADGRLNLTAVVLLAPQLNAVNHRELMEAARHRTRREVEEVLAQWRPAAPVDDSIRRLPERRVFVEQPLGPAPPRAPGGAGRMGQFEEAGRLFALGGIEPGAQPAPEAGPPHGDNAPAASGAPTPPDPPPGWRAPDATPGAAPAALPGRYRIQFTTDADTYRRLLQVRELMRHQVPSGDLALIFDRALSLLHDELARRKYGMLKSRQPAGAGPGGASPGVGARHAPREAIDRADDTPLDPQGGPPDDPPRGAPPAPKRHIPAGVRRAVWRRDGGRCAFVGTAGLRCLERGWLEFHHRLPFARGGPSTVENLELRCRAHNLHEAEPDFRPYDPSGQGDLV